MLPELGHEAVIEVQRGAVIHRKLGLHHGRLLGEGHLQHTHLLDRLVRLLQLLLRPILEADELGDKLVVRLGEHLGHCLRLLADKGAGLV